MSIAKKLSGVARGPADVSWDLDFAYYSGGSEGDGSIASIVDPSKTLSVSSQDVTPFGIYIGDSGTKAYTCGLSNGRVFQYNLSVPYDLSSGSYASKSFLFSSQNTTMTGINFNPTGTKMYLAGQAGNDAIYQYSLSTAWDVSTASYDSVTLDTSAQTATLYGLSFSSDGTIFYIGCQTNVAVYQYNLSTAWDLSTASYSGTSLSLSGIISSPRAPSISSDGTKLYMCKAGLDIYEFHLSTPFDLSTATDTGITYRAIGSSSGIHVLDDKSFVYIMNESNDRFEQYSINNRGIEGLDGAAYTGKSFSVATQSTTPRDVHLSPDGTKMYLASSSNQRVWQYTLSTAFDVSTAASPTDYVVSEDSQPFGVYVREDGLKLYVVGNTNDSIFQYSMSTAFDISTISYDSKSFSVATQTGTPTAVTFKPDGTKMYVTDQVSDEIHQYTLSTAWDVSTASYDSKKLTTTSGQTLLNAVNISSDGTKVVTCDDTTNSLHMYRLTTAWEIDTGIDTGVSLSVSSQDGSVLGAYMSEAGFLYMVGATNDTIYQYVLGGVDVSSQTTIPRQGQFNDDGTKFYICNSVNSTTNVVLEYVMSTPYDLSTASYNVSFNASAQVTDADGGVAFKPDGTVMYIADGAVDDVFQYTLSTAWDITTATYASKSFSSPGAVIGGVRFNSDGTKMYISDSTQGIYEVDLSTAWDISTGTYNSVVLAAANEIGFDFNPDGLQLFVANNGTDSVDEYILSTAWDLSTASLGKTYTDPSLESFSGIWFKPDGLSFFVSNSVFDNVQQFTIGIQ